MLSSYPQKYTNPLFINIFLVQQKSKTITEQKKQSQIPLPIIMPKILLCTSVILKPYSGFNLIIPCTNSILRLMMSWDFRRWYWWQYWCCYKVKLGLYWVLFFKGPLCFSFKVVSLSINLHYWILLRYRTELIIPLIQAPLIPTIINNNN